MNNLDLIQPRIDEEYEKWFWSHNHDGNKYTLVTDIKILAKKFGMEERNAKKIITNNLELFKGEYFEFSSIMEQNSENDLNGKHAGGRPPKSYFLTKRGCYQWINQLDYNRYDGNRKNLIIDFKRWLVDTGVNATEPNILHNLEDLYKQFDALKMRYEKMEESNMNLAVSTLTATDEIKKIILEKIYPNDPQISSSQLRYLKKMIKERLTQLTLNNPNKYKEFSAKFQKEFNMKYGTGIYDELKHSQYIDALKYTDKWGSIVNSNQKKSTIEQSSSYQKQQMKEIIQNLCKEYATLENIVSTLVHMGYNKIDAEMFVEHMHNEGLIMKNRNKYKAI